MFTEAQIAVVVDICERVIVSEQPCVLCGEKFLPARLQRHLAHHMQQLALFSLPQSMDDSDDDEGGSVAAHASREGSSNESNPRSTSPDIGSTTSEERVENTYTVPGEIPDMDHQNAIPPEEITLNLGNSKLDRFKLETSFGDGTVTHTTYQADIAAREHRARVQTWTDKKHLRSGGVVMLQQADGGELRVVKKVRAEARRMNVMRDITVLTQLTHVCTLFAGL